MILKTSVLLFIAAVSIEIFAVEGTKVKIYISHEAVDLTKLSERQASSSACDDKVLVPRSNASLTGRLVSLNSRVLFYQSVYVRQSIDRFIRDATVPGTQTTAFGVLQALKDGGCPVYIFGGAIRDQFLGKMPNDVDTEVDCNVSTIVRICRERWGAAACGEEDEPVTSIGKPRGNPANSDFAPTDRTFYTNLTYLEFTTNSLAYDINGLDVVIDLAGTGVRDTCNRSIRIPSDDDSLSSWDAWRDAYMDSGKLYRYWKLRFKGYSAINANTSTYIISNVKNLIEANNGLDFKEVYCEKVYDGARYSTNGNLCVVSSELCLAKSQTAATYSSHIEEDLGRSYVESRLGGLPTCNGECIIHAAITKMERLWYSGTWLVVTHGPVRNGCYKRGGLLTQVEMYTKLNTLPGLLLRGDLTYTVTNINWFHCDILN